ncbi:MAG TPA: DUF4870 domain-containing protein [Anaerolineaceae bacterium]
MTTFDSAPISQDERVLAAISHVSILMPMVGFFAPLIIWITQKEKSRYVAFQSLQALAYQFAMILAYLLSMGCYVAAVFAPILAMPFLASGSSEISPLIGAGFLFPFVVLALIGLGAMVFVVYGLVAAVLAYQGKPFRYALIGRFVERSMQPKSSPSAAP